MSIMFRFLAFLIIFSALLSCGKGKTILLLLEEDDTLKVDKGVLNDSIYYNKSFDLSFVVPYEWEVKTKEEIKEMSAKQYELNTNAFSDPTLSEKKSPTVDSTKSIVLFYANELPTYEPKDIKAFFMVCATVQKIDGLLLNNEIEYIDYTKNYEDKILGLSRGTTSEITEISISGNTFYKIERIIKLDDENNLHTIHYVKLFDRTFLDIMMQYGDHEKNELLFKTFESIKIGKQY